MTQDVIARKIRPMVPGLICAAILAGAITMTAAAGPAAAIIVTAPGAEATASASSAPNDSGTVTDQGNPSAAASNLAVNDRPFPDEASSEARATVAGPVGSRSFAEGASGSGLASQASATAAWAAQFITSGTSPGSGSVDIDFNVSIDGSLFVQNNNGGAGLDDVLAAVGVTLSATGSSGTTEVFNGSAKLATVTNVDPAVLTRSGDWADGARDGDFDMGTCSRFRCTVNVTAGFNLDDTFLVDFGEVFRVDLMLSTDAFIFAGREVGAEADFFNTVDVSLSTSTVGVTVAQATGEPMDVPEPGTLALMGNGLIGLLLLHRRSRRRRAIR